MRLDPPHSIVWSDGVRWTVDGSTFVRTLAQLDQVSGMIEGSAAILARLHSLTERDEIHVDDFAPSELDRAILTAALERALEETRANGMKAAGIDDAGTWRAFLASVTELHRLFVTDVTAR